MKKRSMTLVTSVTNLLVLFLLTASFQVFAAVTAEKTPNDVYRQVELLAEDVKKLRLKNNIKTDWPSVEFVVGYEPQHVYQKTLEILGKINSYRTKVSKTGGITVPRFPGRDITPNEVYSVVTRLRQEINLLVQNREIQKVQKIQKIQKVQSIANRSPSDVYAALAEVSIALEETLGLRSIGPPEVYMRSVQVVELSRFLRKSQNLPVDVVKPARTQGKFPNHVLRSVHELLGKIRVAEHNLWMKAFQQPKFPRRVITPSDVFDAMGVAIAELHRIQFRLGLEREFSDPQEQKKKRRTPDDVIQNATWAEALLPLFDLASPLQQYNRSALNKTPNQVYAVTEQILRRLIRYRRLRGIQALPDKAYMVHGLQPQHVYGKALEVMRKVDKLRQTQGLGSITVPNYPMRLITPSEVFDITRRLDDELTLVFQRETADNRSWGGDVAEYEDKLPSDVFLNMQKISNLIDTLLGQDGYTTAEMHREVIAIKQDLLLIANHLDKTLPDSIWSGRDGELSDSAHDLSLLTEEVLSLISRIKQRAGMLSFRNVDFYTGEITSRIDAFNRISLISTELAGLKVFLDLSGVSQRPSVQKDKTLDDVLMVLDGVARALQTILYPEK